MEHVLSRARSCIAQKLASGMQAGQLIISDSGGVIVANSAVSYPDGLTKWKLRSNFTLEVREGRFRIEQTGIERFNSTWGGVGKWPGSGWKKAEAALLITADSVAACTLGKDQKAEW